MMNVAQTTVSARLATLSRVGLVKSERRSRTVLYWADLDGSSDMTLFLKDCCGSNPRPSLWR